MPKPILYDYWRSSAAYRVRIALNLKGVDYESRPVDLREDEQKSAEYRALNPQGLVPMLEIDGHRLTQSLAIINYLDLRYPNQPLLPASAAERAHVVSMAMAIACDIHPLNNLRVLKYLKDQLGHSQDEVDAWYRHWIVEGLPALEAMAAPARRQVPVRQRTDRRRRLPDPAALQCAAVRRAAGRLSDVAACRRQCQSDGSVCRSAP